jgi:hypothetical protein
VKAELAAARSSPVPPIDIYSPACWADCVTRTLTVCEVLLNLAPLTLKSVMPL